jgi:hypothetical protein
MSGLTAVNELTTLQAACWLCLLLFCVLYGLRALWRPVEMLAAPLLVAVGMVAVGIGSRLGEPPWAVARFLDPDHYSRYLVLSVLATAAFALGFSGGRALPLRAAEPAGEPPAWTLRAWAALVVLGGLLAQAVFVARSGGFTAFYSAQHGNAGAWEETSAYLYLLPLSLFPALYLLCADRLRNRDQGKAIGLLTATALAFLLFQGIVFGNRADVIRLVLIGGSLFLLFREPSRANLLAAGLLAVMGLAVVSVLPMLREALHLGAEVSVAEALARGAEVNPDVTGNTLFFAAAVVGVADAKGVLDGGFAWLYPFVGMVPRALWPGKPYVGAWSIPYDGLIQPFIDWELALGSAPTGVADAFLRFGWLSPLAWLVLGGVGGRLWRRCLERRTILSVGLLIGYLLALVYVVLQDYVAAFYQWMFFVAPLGGLAALQRLAALLGAGAPLAAAEADEHDERAAWPPGRGLGEVRPLPCGPAPGGRVGGDRPPWPRDLDRGPDLWLGAGDGRARLSPPHPPFGA